ncbi:MAG: hypothetical protein Q8941_23705 [Bacteroidota bacterium]|nr:hypothetical protein [Bacteroidota bacterium]
MKKIFFIISIFILSFSFASAQDNGKPYFRIVPRKSETNVFDVSPVNPPPQVAPLMKLEYTLSNGNKVYELPQDNMPCLVPNMSSYNMPVLKPDMLQFNMPNAAVPYPCNPILVPQTVSPDKFKRLQKEGKIIFGQ